MTHRFCHNCQIFIQSEEANCFKCNQPAESLVSATNSTTETRPLISNNTQEKTDTGFKPIQETRIESDPSQNPLLQHFPKFDNINSGRSSDPQKTVLKATPFKVHYQDLPNPAFEKPSLSRVIVPTIAVIIAVVLLGIGVSYTRSYFAAMPEQRVDQLMASKHAYENGLNFVPQPLHPETAAQTPWFWGWFRSKPTAEEVFEHYQNVTGVTTENTKFQTAHINATVEVSTPTSEIDAVSADLKRQAASNVFPKDGKFHSQNSPEMGPWSFVGQVVMLLKAPDKAVISMEMIPKIVDPRGIRIYVNAGISGDQSWSHVKVNAGSQVTEKDGDNDVLPPAFSKNDNFLATAICRSAYEKLEFAGIQPAMNRQNYLIKGTRPNGKMDLIYFDTETGLINKYSGISGDIYVINYAQFKGIWMPSEVLQKAGPGLVRMTLQEISKDTPINDSLFKKPEQF